MIFKLENIRFKRFFQNRETVLFHDFNLSVPEKGVFTIVGPSGCGKSTLLRFFNRLHDPDSGTFFFRGRLLNDYPIHELRRRVGMLFQLPALPQKTIRANLLYGPSLIHKSVSEEEFASYMRLVALDPGLLDREPQSLSVGEQQRASLARVLANEPEALLLDEPTASLDASSVLKLEETILNLVAKKNLTAIWVSHDPEQVKRLGGPSLTLEKCHA